MRVQIFANGDKEIETQRIRKRFICYILDTSFLSVMCILYIFTAFRANARTAVYFLTTRYELRSQVRFSHTTARRFSDSKYEIFQRLSCFSDFALVGFHFCSFLFQISTVSRINYVRVCE